MTEFEGTVVMNARQVTPEEMKKFFPSLPDKIIALLCSFSLIYDPLTTFVYADTKREYNDTGYYQVLDGHLEIGLNNPEALGEFIPVHQIKSTNDPKNAVGILIPRNYVSNSFSIRSGCDGATIIRMPYEFLDDILMKNDEVRADKLKKHKQMLMDMINGLNKLNDSLKKVRIMLILVQEFFESVENITEKEMNYINSQLFVLVGGIYAGRNNVQGGVTDIGVTALMGSFVRKKFEKIKQHKSNSSI